MTNEDFKILDTDSSIGVATGVGSFDVFKIDSDDFTCGLDDEFVKEYTCLVTASPFSAELNCGSRDLTTV